MFGSVLGNLIAENWRRVAQAPAQWFRSEVLARLSGVKRGGEPGQFYAHCPVPRHGDRHASFGIKQGDQVSIVYHCQKDCTNEEIRSALADLGVPEEHLGVLGLPSYEERRRVRATSEERRELERVRRELADLKSAVNGLLNTKMTQAMRHVRIQAAIEGTGLPAERKEFIALAARGGVSQSKRYDAWDEVCTADGQIECVTEDHVVLTRPDGGGQVVQRRTRVRIPPDGISFPERENGQNGTLQVSGQTAECPDSPRGKTDETDRALEALHSAGLTVRPQKPAA
jgi:hypothetical protein